MKNSIQRKGSQTKMKRNLLHHQKCQNKILNLTQLLMILNNQNLQKYNKFIMFRIMQHVKMMIQLRINLQLKLNDIQRMRSNILEKRMNSLLPIFMNSLLPIFKLKWKTEKWKGSQPIPWIIKFSNSRLIL